MISPSRLDEVSWCFSEHRSSIFARYLSPQSRSPPEFFPREPPVQAMAVSRGSYRRRDLWRLHVLHRVLPCHLILPHTLVGLPANVATSCNTSSTNQLPEISFQVGRSVLLNKDYCFDTYASSLQIYGQLGTLGICSRGFFLGIQSAPLLVANNVTFVPFQCQRSEVKTRPHYGPP